MRPEDRDKCGSPNRAPGIKCGLRKLLGRLLFGLSPSALAGSASFVAYLMCDAGLTLRSPFGAGPAAPGHFGGAYYRRPVTPTPSARADAFSLTFADCGGATSAPADATPELTF